MAADADGQTWFQPNGQHPPYPAGWQRWQGWQGYKGWQALPGSGLPPQPKWSQDHPPKPNHDNGQNVMYLDGHVKWTDANYCSHDPTDNIFCPNSTNNVQWNPDIDAYLWDGLDARTVQP